MYFQEEPEHITILRRQMRRFVDEQMPRELVRRWDREMHMPTQVVAKLAGLGVCGLTMDEEYGGLGRDIVAGVAVVEELSRRSMHVSGPFIQIAPCGLARRSEKALRGGEIDGEALRGGGGPGDRARLPAANGGLRSRRGLTTRSPTCAISCACRSSAGARTCSATTSWAGSLWRVTEPVSRRAGEIEAPARRARRAPR